MSRANCTIQNWIVDGIKVEPVIDGRKIAPVIGEPNSGLSIRGRRIALSPSRIAIPSEFKPPIVVR